MRFQNIIKIEEESVSVSVSVKCEQTKYTVQYNKQVNLKDHSDDDMFIIYVKKIKYMYPNPYFLYFLKMR